MSSEAPISTGTTTLAPTPAASPTPTEPIPTATPPVLSEDQRVLGGVTDLTQVAKELGEGAINDTPSEYKLNGADLGSMFDKDGKLYMVFGDSFGCCMPGRGGPGGGGPGDAIDWRSNTMAIISDNDPRDGLTFDSMVSDRPGHAAELLPKGALDVTVIPTYGLAVGDRMYLHYMAVEAWDTGNHWYLNESGLAYSDDEGNTWTKDGNTKRDGGSNFGQVAIVRWEGEVYLFGIPGGRLGGVKLAKVDENAVLDIGRYQYFTGLSGDTPQWVPEEEAAVLIVPPLVGELSVIWNPFLGRWIMTYLDERRTSLVIREAPELWGPWSPALLLVQSGPLYPRPYGAYMHPRLLEHEGEIIYFTMSLWGPYSVFLMRARLVTG